MCNYLLSALGRIFTGFLKLYHGFSLGVEDILVKPMVYNGCTSLPYHIARKFGVLHFGKLTLKEVWRLKFW